MRALVSISFFQLVLTVVCFNNLVVATLRDKSELTSHCYHFPAKDFGKQNNVKLTYGSSPHVLLEAGSQAIDFVLPDINVSIFLIFSLIYC
jgi:hypothetical protein